MGRTVIPYSRQIQYVEGSLQEFRRGLRKPDQEIFDELIRFAKLQVQAGVMASSAYPIDSMLLSMMIELKKEITHLKNELAKIESRVEKHE
ncbi:hypothetical protein CH373_17820 [Leptospira perolatii]|uniref:DUF8156 domain-containing protein n=1 Tax=Leptospira perolatii TaxID=2023191 RepID=A0A2M9ZI91_9LEPT|nr:hypothetical protein [Leptospira perolatii]PJZ68229.1 hypothetical protein CH360_17395 [Leptospira perolatii]PJZ71776.1 hypothetical protein CH373_17820 [Leptospira perolatii]